MRNRTSWDPVRSAMEESAPTRPFEKDAEGRRTAGTRETPVIGRRDTRLQDEGVLVSIF